MSKIINGDITRVVKEGIMLQQVNCQGAMGAGVALAILKKWPFVRSQYVAFCQQIKPQELLGSVQEIKLSDKLTLVNSFSQLDYGTNKRQTDEALLIANIKRTADKARKQNQQLYVPFRVGCGLAGGNWSHVYQAVAALPNLVFVKY